AAELRDHLSPLVVQQAGHHKCRRRLNHRGELGRRRTERIPALGRVDHLSREIWLRYGALKAGNRDRQRAVGTELRGESLDRRKRQQKGRRESGRLKPVIVALPCLLRERRRVRAAVRELRITEPREETAVDRGRSALREERLELCGKCRVDGANRGL